MVEHSLVITEPTSSRDYFSTSLQKRILIREWCGTGEETGNGGQGLVLLLHGLGDTALRHQWAASLCAAAGYRVVGFDWPGNGGSDGIRGDMPTILETGPFLEEMIGELGRNPTGVFAHSTGAFLFLPWLATNPPSVSDLEWIWLSSPLLRPSHGQGKLKVLAAQRIAPYFPRLTLSTGVRTRDCFHTGFDPALEESLRKDGSHRRVTLRFATDLVRNEGGIVSLPERLRSDLACLVSQGSEDEVCPPVYAEDFFRRLRSPEKRFLFVSGARHEPFRERLHDGITNAATSWLRSRMRGGPSSPPGVNG